MELGICMKVCVILCMKVHKSLKSTIVATVTVGIKVCSELTLNH